MLASEGVNARNPVFDSARTHGEGQNAVQSDNEGISETAWLQDVLYAIQGIDGRFIKYSASLNEFRVLGSQDVSKSVIDVIMKLSELGVMYRNVVNFIRAKNMSQSKSKMMESVVLQSLISRIQQELVEFYRFTAVIQKHIEKISIAESMGKQNGGLTDGQTPLTLRKLLILSEPSNKKMKVLCSIIDIVEKCLATKSETQQKQMMHNTETVGTNGDVLDYEMAGSKKSLSNENLLSVLHYYSGHGDPRVREFMTGLLMEVTTPFYSTIKSWIFEGKLVDPYNEFFIVQDEKSESKDIWRQHYYLRLSAIPSFMDKETARKIFIIGKSLKFLIMACDEENYLLSRGTMAENAEGFVYGNQEVLQSTIDKIYEETNSKVFATLMNKYRLFDHICAVKKILLLEQGDLAHCMVEELNDTLTRPASLIYRHTLSASLEAAIRASNIQYESKDILSRIDVRLLEPESAKERRGITGIAAPLTSTTIGWDVFALEYAINTPLDTILTAKMMEKYTKISQFLWKIRRVEYTVNSTWKKRNIIATKFVKDKKDLEASSAIHEALIVLKTMSYFISKLQFYISFEVLECSFHEFKTFVLNFKGDMDSLIQRHASYVDEIMDKLFLDEKHATAKTQLDSVLDQIMNYGSLFEKFCDVCIISNSGKDVNEFLTGMVNLETQGKLNNGSSPASSNSELDLINSTFTFSQDGISSNFSTNLSRGGLFSGEYSSPHGLLRASWDPKAIGEPLRKVLESLGRSDLILASGALDPSRMDIRTMKPDPKSIEISFECLSLLVRNHNLIRPVLEQQTQTFNNSLVQFIDLPGVNKTSLYAL